MLFCLCVQSILSGSAHLSGSAYSSSLRHPGAGWDVALKLYSRAIHHMFTLKYRSPVSGKKVTTVCPGFIPLAI